MGRGRGGPHPGTGGLGGGRPASTLPESPPGSERGSVRVNTAATAANTATLPRRPPECHGPARAAGPPPPSPWRPMGPDARQPADSAPSPRYGPSRPAERRAQPAAASGPARRSGPHLCLSGGGGGNGGCAPARPRSFLGDTTRGSMLASVCF